LITLSDITSQIKSSIRIAGLLVAFVLGFIALTSAAYASAPTFNKDVAPILFKHCANCHRPGEIGASLSLLSYNTARPRADSIKQSVLRREMPPWPADPARSMKFRNDPRLSPQEIDTIVAWVNAGAPKGNDADLPPLPVFPKGWLHPKGVAPDLVLPMPELHVPAQGEIPYVSQMIKVPFSDDKWVVAMQVRPGNPAIVHHMAITEVALDEGVTPANIDELSRIARQLGLTSGSIPTRRAVADPAHPTAFDMLGVYTPGSTFERYPDGSAKVLKGGKNMYLDFNIHYQTTGKPETDQSTLALWFQLEPPEHQLFRVPASGETIIADGKELLIDAPGQKAEGTQVAIPPIPPYAENYELIAITAYPEPVTIYQLQPHAHLRGKDFKYAVVYPDGHEETILTVPKYDFHWQLAYELDEPLKLPAGSKLVVTAHYDNSLKNEHLMHHHHDSSAHDVGNHDASDHEASEASAGLSPEREVHFREANQSWDEMFTPFIQYSIDRQGQGQQSNTNLVGVAEVVGCLDQSPSAGWALTKGSDPVASKKQTTSSAELSAAATEPLGNRSYELLGVDVFSPSNDKGQKVAVKGILINDPTQSRLNVTSLQAVASTCP
jgi:mono/diheme cytochrome c family protein